jgi:predicted nuclease of predicted toxin-antitoxin system
MRLLLDVHLSRQVVHALRDRGHDAARVAEVGLRGEPDHIVWEWAIREGRVVVTYDTDDFPVLYHRYFQEGVSHPGLVVISSKTIAPNDIGALVRALDRLIQTNTDLTDQIVFLTR